MNPAHATEPVRPTASRTAWNGFYVHQLRNDFVSVAVAPELGAKVVSLKNLRTGREWMYRPENFKLFQNQLGDDFARSTMMGWDECLPTISPCIWRGRALPDHGEAWAAAWKLDEAVWRQGRIRTSVPLPVSPLEFARTLELQGDKLDIEYHLKNQSDEPQDFLWAMHPLLELHKGDRLQLTPETRRYLAKEPWLDFLDFPQNGPGCAKAYAGPLTERQAGVFNAATGDGLQFTWDADAGDTLGLWLTRGGWHGHHHLALEPANGAPDSLAQAAGEWKRCGVLAPLGEKKWRVQIRVLGGSDGLQK